ncbi:MAG: TetR/AcrR family transcriptional regulator [bacterium]|nr:TetR/AcrR family transcriptional regulator [bacterium]
MNDERRAEPRRTPVQRRGAERVEAILGAAEALIAADGFEALTLTAVAERSGSSIGSLYRFFADREQLLLALAERLARAVGDHASGTPPTPIAAMTPAEFAAWFIAWLGATTQTHPALLVLLHHIGPHCVPLEARAMAPIDEFFRTHAPGMHERERQLATRMAMTLVGEGMKLPEHVPGATMHEGIREVGSALAAYLGARSSG